MKNVKRFVSWLTIVSFSGTVAFAAAFLILLLTNSGVAFSAVYVVGGFALALLLGAFD